MFQRWREPNKLCKIASYAVCGFLHSTRVKVGRKGQEGGKESGLRVLIYIWKCNATTEYIEILIQSKRLDVYIRFVDKAKTQTY